MNAICLLLDIWFSVNNRAQLYFFQLAFACVMASL